jgi:Mn2+/Fe2+ NRAMP family transporter
METISGRQPFEGAAVGAGGVAALTARFVGSRHLMGEFVLGRGAKIGSWGLALLILALNATLILQMLA